MQDTHLPVDTEVDIVEMELETMFSGEEAYGKFLDLNLIFEQYLNLKGVKKVGYLAYLSDCDKFELCKYGNFRNRL